MRKNASFVSLEAYQKKFEISKKSISCSDNGIDIKKNNEGNAQVRGYAVSDLIRHSMVRSITRDHSVSLFWVFRSNV